MAGDPTLPVGPGGPPTKASPNIELTLANLANDAMAKGADPAKATDLLRSHIAFLRANPDEARMATEALAGGTDPLRVASVVSQRASATNQGFNGSGSGRTFDTNVPKAGMIQTALDAVPFATKAMSAIDAAIPGGNSYEQNLLNRRSMIAAFQERHPGQALAGTIAGAAGPIIATLGTSAPTDAALLAPKATLLGRIAKGALTGIGLGAVQGASQAHGSLSDYAKEIGIDAGVSGALGGVLPIGTGVAGYLAKKVGAPAFASRVAQATADVLPAGSAPNRFLARLAATTGPRGEAASVIGQRVAMDDAAGAGPTVPITPGMPSLALDRGGPNVQGLAENVVNRPGTGKAVLVNAIKSRQAKMQPAIQTAIAEGTGVGPGTGLQPLRSAIQAQSKEAGEMFGAARAATEGQGVQSPTLEAARQTPIGQQAEAWARVQKANRMKQLPTITTEQPSDAAQQLASMGVSQDRIVAALGDQATEKSTQELPDPELLHYMKQYIAHVAKMGVHDGAEGKLATQAQGLLGVWGDIRDELPPVWRAADDAFAKHARQIDQMNAGRNIFRTQENPAGPARKAVQTSLDAVEQRTANASPEEQNAFRTGVGIAAQTRAERLGTPGGPQSPGRLFGGANAKRMDLGFQTPEQAAGFQQRVTGWDAVQQQANSILGNSRTATRGAEEAARMKPDASANVATELLRGNVGNAIRAIGSDASNQADNLARQRVDAEIARILANPNPSALDEARVSALLRYRAGTIGGRLLPRLAGNEAGANQIGQHVLSRVSTPLLTRRSGT